MENGCKQALNRARVVPQRRAEDRRDQTLLAFSRIEKLPSVETQFVEWVSWAREEKFWGLSAGQWLRKRGYEAYVRRANRTIDGFEISSLDLASISVPAKDRGKGWFRNFVALAKAVSNCDGIYIENAGNPDNFWMDAALRRWGFKEIGEGTKNYWCPMRPRH